MPDDRANEFEEQHEAEDDLQRFRATLDRLASDFGAATKDDSDQDNDAALLRESFSYTQCAAIATLAVELTEFLFDTIEDVTVRMEDTEITPINPVSMLESHSIREFIRIVDNYFGKFQALYMDGPGGPPSSAELIDFLSQWLRNVSSAFGISLFDGVNWSNSYQAAIRRWGGRAGDIEKGWLGALNAGASAQAARSAAEEAERYRDAARLATGETGAITMGSHFRTVSETEQTRAFHWTLATFGLIIAVLAAGIVVIVRSTENEWTDTLIHLALVIPIAGGAAYASRIARHHRVLARWALTASAQIETIQAFSATLSSNQNRDKLILSLGTTVFGPPSYGDSKDEFSTIPPDFLEALKKLIEKLPTPG